MRRLFMLCSACSLLLCAAVCGIWVRSHYRVDTVSRRSFDGTQLLPLMLAPALLVVVRLRSRQRHRSYLGAGSLLPHAHRFGRDRAIVVAAALAGAALAFGAGRLG